MNDRESAVTDGAGETAELSGCGRDRDALVTVVLPPLLACLGAVVVAVATFSGGWIVTAAVALCVLALAAGWSDLLRLPHRPGTMVLVGGFGVAALVAGTLAVAPDRSVQRPLAVFAAAIAIALLASFGRELLRRDGRPDVVESLTGTVAGQVIAVLAAGWVLLSHTPAGSSAVVVAVAGVVAARLAAPLIGLMPRVGVWLAIAAGPVGSFAASFFVPGMVAATAVGIGLGVGGVGVVIDQLFAPVVSRRVDLSVLARAAAPLAAAGTLAYAAVRIAG